MYRHPDEIIAEMISAVAFYSLSERSDYASGYNDGLAQMRDHMKDWFKR